MVLQIVDRLLIFCYLKMSSTTYTSSVKSHAIDLILLFQYIELQTYHAVEDQKRICGQLMYLK